MFVSTTVDSFILVDWGKILHGYLIWWFWTICIHPYTTFVLFFELLLKWFTTYMTYDQEINQNCFTINYIESTVFAIPSDPKNILGVSINYFHVIISSWPDKDKSLNCFFFYETWEMQTSTIDKYLLFQYFSNSFAGHTDFLANFTFKM